MHIKSRKEQAFDALSPDARLHVTLLNRKNITPTERFTYHINYIVDKVHTGSVPARGASSENMKIIMRELDEFINLYRFQKESTIEHLLSTALFSSVACPELIKMLLDAGANPDFQDIFGNTPLHHAVWNCTNLDYKSILLSAELLASSMENSEVKNCRNHSAVESISTIPRVLLKENREQFTADFKRIIHKPPLYYTISVPVTERSNASFKLTAQDWTDISVYHKVADAPLVIKNPEYNVSIATVELHALLCRSIFKKLNLEPIKKIEDISDPDKSHRDSVSRDSVSIDMN